MVVRGASGAYTNELVASVGKLVRKPHDVPFDQAASLGVAAGTAYQAVESLAPGEGEVLLIHGASGAVGQAAIQFARRRGATGGRGGRAWRGCRASLGPPPMGFA